MRAALRYAFSPPALPMARLPRLSPVDVPVHVLQRGNNRQLVFRGDDDYAFYLDTLRMAAREHDFAIHAFALMPNHVHLVGTPKVAESCLLYTSDAADDSALV